MLSVGPVLTIDDAIGLKVRALHERTTHRDFIDVHAATNAGYTRGDLERLGRRHTPDFSLTDLADRLSGAADVYDRGFAAYGLDAAATCERGRRPARSICDPIWRPSPARCNGLASRIGTPTSTNSP
jgi:hypothetical protein